MGMAGKNGNKTHITKSIVGLTLCLNLPQGLPQTLPQKLMTCSAMAILCSEMTQSLAGSILFHSEAEAEAEVEAVRLMAELAQYGNPAIQICDMCDRHTRMYLHGEFAPANAFATHSRLQTQHERSSNVLNSYAKQEGHPHHQRQSPTIRKSNSRKY